MVVEIIGNGAKVELVNDIYELTISFEGMGGGGGATTAADVSIADAGNYYASTDVEGALQEVGADLVALDGGLDTAEANITALDGRVTATEGDITSLDGRVTATEGGIATLQGDVTALDGRVTATEGNISTLQGDVTALDGRLDTAEGQISAFNGIIVGYADSFTSKQFISAIQVLTISAGLIAWNMASGQRARVTLTSSATLSNPTNLGAAFPDLEVTQDGTGGRVLSFGTNFVFSTTYAAAATTANSVTIYHFQLRSDGKLAVNYTHYVS